jgi:hypothetical protein
MKCHLPPWFLVTCKLTRDNRSLQSFIPLGTEADRTTRLMSTMMDLSIQARFVVLVNTSLISEWLR